jgi:hypothetical protein
MKFKLPSLAACAVLACAGAANAATTWTDWVNADTLGSSAANTVKGTLAVGGGVDVVYAGPTDVVELSGAGWWGVAGTPDPYATTGAPDQKDIIRIVGGDRSTYKISFSKPVIDPVMAILSLGQNGYVVTYDFAQTPTLLDSGAGWWGGCATCLSVAGNVVTGTEGHGVVMFKGTYSELSWTTPIYEYWHGFTVGVAGAVPEPQTWALLAAGLGVLSAVGKRRRRLAQ